VFIRSAKEVGIFFQAISRYLHLKFRMDNTRILHGQPQIIHLEALSFKLFTESVLWAVPCTPQNLQKRIAGAVVGIYQIYLQYFSEKWHEYPFNKAVNVASNLDGMEYPGMVFVRQKDTGICTGRWLITIGAYMVPDDRWQQ